MSDHACPSCGNKMPFGAVLCTACGFHTASGRRLSGADAALKRGPTKVGPPSPAFQAITALIKPAILFVVLGSVGYCGWRTIQWLRYDPLAHQKDVVAKLKTGMTVQQIVDAAGEEPATVYRWVTRMKKTNDGEKEIEIPVQVPLRINYMPNFMKVYTAEELEQGFYFIYSFFSGGKFTVNFDPKGIVDSVDDISGMPGLPQGTAVGS